MARHLFTHANLLDGEHAAVPNSTVIVEGDRIVDVKPDQADVGREPGDVILDCSGRTLMPGMTQGHFHSTYHNIDFDSPPPGLEFAPAYATYVAAHNAGLALRTGFTSVVCATEPSDITPSLKKAINDGLVVGPRVVPGSREIITTADSTDTVPWYWEAKAPGGMCIADGADEFRKATRIEIKRGAEVIKLFATGGHGTALPAEYSSITAAEMGAAVDAAHNLGRRVRAHVASRDGVMRCLDAGIDIIDHGDGIDDECIKRMADQNVCFVPSAYGHWVLSELTGEKNLNGPWGKVVRDTCAALKPCVEAGVTVVLGDDWGGSIIPHGTYGKELPFWRDYAGFGELEILEWATVNGGKIVGLPDLGRVEVGYLADLVLVDGDPSHDLEVLANPDNIVAVMRDGLLLVDNRGSDLETRRLPSAHI